MLIFLITRVGRSSRVETLNTYRIGKKNKYKNRAHIISNNKNPVCTKALLNIAIF